MKRVALLAVATLGLAAPAAQATYPGRNAHIARLAAVAPVASGA